MTRLQGPADHQLFFTRDGSNDALSHKDQTFS